MQNVMLCGFGKLGLDSSRKLMEKGYNIKYMLTHKEHHDESMEIFAIENDIAYSFEDMRKNINHFQRIIKDKQIDYLISVNYRYIIPREIFEIPKYSINIHGSLLPRYRGRTPHVWSIINNEEFSGVTCHLIEESVDVGNIIEQVKIKIESHDTGHTLLQKFLLLYPDLLVRSLEKLEQGENTIVQDESQASYYGKRTPDMGYIDFYKKSYQIINFVRAQAHPYPGAYYYLNNGKKIVINKIIISETFPNNLIEGVGVLQIIENEIYVRSLDGVLRLIDYALIN